MSWAGTIDLGIGAQPGPPFCPTEDGGCYRCLFLVVTPPHCQLGPWLTPASLPSHISFPGKGLQASPGYHLVLKTV